MESILEKIITSRLIDIKRDKALVSLHDITTLAEELPPPSHDFLKTLSTPAPHGIHVIAEVKKASPSKGVLTENFHPVKIATDYQKGGASCLSVLTEEKFFLGSNQYLQDIAQSVSLPLLRKDFIVDAYQIYQAKILGASAFLLIVDCLKPQQIKEFIQLGTHLGLTALVEVHREEEVNIALDQGAKIIGINNRNLRTFETSLNVTFNLRGKIPKGIVVVSESGIKTAKDLKQLQEHQVDAVLVGESLMRETENIVTNLEKLLAG